MTIGQNDWLQELRDAMDGRPVRWAESCNIVGDYDGRERTLEVFNANASDQRTLVRRLRPLRAELESGLGGPIIVIFHTTAESVRLYPDFIREALTGEATQGAALEYELPEDIAPLAVDLELHVRTGTAPGTGSTTLPRVAA